MSELITKQNNRATIRWKLLAGVSALALTGYINSSSLARADDASRPVLWIELGGELDGMNGGPKAFTAPFFASFNAADAAVMSDAQKPIRSSFAEDAHITFQPEDSDWVFSAAIRIGRADAPRHPHHQTNVAPVTNVLFGNDYIITPTKKIFSDAQTGQQEKHVILDFQAGKDLGLGLFGHDGQSVVSAGVRFAQFTWNSHGTFHGRPIDGFSKTVGPNSKYIIHLPFYSTYTAMANSTRHFRAEGPSLSWNASASVAGNKDSAQVTIDWGINAAALFGRQTVQTHHQTTGQRHQVTGGLNYVHNVKLYTNPPVDRDRSRSVTVPNLGGFAGVSLKFPNAKFSLGYRADFFFGAMDGGIDTRKNENVGFYGPFASVSVGIGD